MSSTSPPPPQPPDHTAEGWSAVASAYDSFVAPFLAKYAEDALRLVDLRPGERVLDVAAGSGALSLQAAAQGAHVLAVDFAPGMVARLRARVAAEGLDVRSEVMDGQALALDDGTFDVACSNFGLIFFPDRAAGFREMQRVLRPGGRAVVTAWSRPERIEWMAMFQDALGEAAPELPPPARPPPIWSLADPETFAREMREAGLRDVRVETVRHAWTLPSAAAGWDAMRETNPVFPAMMARLGPGRMDALREGFLRRLRERADDGGRGAVTLLGEAHVGVGLR